MVRKWSEIEKVYSTRTHEVRRSGALVLVMSDFEDEDGHVGLSAAQICGKIAAKDGGDATVQNPQVVAKEEDYTALYCGVRAYVPV